MKALRWHGRGDIRLEDVPEPSAGAGEVKVKVKWCCLCGTDLHEYEAGPVLIPAKRPHPRTGKMAPVTLGHEFSGDVVQVGGGVVGINVGDRVTVRPTMPCYHCYYCKKGQHIQCTTLAAVGAAADGGFAEYVVVPADNIYLLPQAVSYEAAAFTEPLSSCIHGVRRGGLKVGDTAAIVGAGPIGLLTLQVAKAAGASKLFVVEPITKRRDVAKQLGATEGFDPREGDVGKSIGNLTDGIRADIAFECAGPPAAMLTALRVSGRGGKIVEIGVMMENCDFPFNTLWMHEKTIITSQGYTDEFPTALSLLADGRVRTEPLVTARIKLDDIIEKGFKELLSERRNEYIKVLVTP